MKNVRHRSKRHLKFIATLPCCVCRKIGRTQAAHIRAGCYILSRKSSDEFAVPLCVECHEHQHKIGEKRFWQEYGGTEVAKKFAQHLFQVSGDKQKGVCLIVNFKKKGR